MTVPSSGELKMLGIFSELNEGDYTALNQDGTNNISLANLSTGTFGTINTANDASDRPDGSTPHSMSEFYSYDHGATSLSTGLTSALYTENLSSNSSWRNFDLADEISLTPYRGITARLVIHYTNGTSGTSYQGDFQVGSIVYFGASSFNFQYSLTNWQTTTGDIVPANAAAYNAASFSSLATGTTSGRFNRRSSSGTPSGGTGLSPSGLTNSNFYAYAETSGNSSTMLGYGFFLRSPQATFANDSDPNISFDIAHYGSNVGSLNVFLDIIST